MFMLLLLRLVSAQQPEPKPEPVKTVEDVLHEDAEMERLQKDFEEKCEEAKQTMAEVAATLPTVQPPSNQEPEPKPKRQRRRPAIVKTP